MSETPPRARRRASSGPLTPPIFPLLAATATGFALPAAEPYVHMGPVPPKKDGDHLSFGKFQKRLPVSVHPRHGLSVDAKEDVPLTDPALPGGCRSIDVVDLHPSLDPEVPQFRGERLDPDAQPPAADRPVSRQLPLHGHDRMDGDGKADPLPCAHHRGVDPHPLPP